MLCFTYFSGDINKDDTDLRHGNFLNNNKHNIKSFYNAVVSP